MGLGISVAELAFASIWRNSFTEEIYASRRRFDFMAIVDDRRRTYTSFDWYPRLSPITLGTPQVYCERKLNKHH
jgi:hypothetical protein